MSNATESAVRFKLQTTVINTEQARKSLLNIQAGAYVSFEGWVRNHHDGKAVEYLEYEAYPPLCDSEAQEIICETMDKWPLHDIKIIHRTGHLDPGDMAVWIGVTSVHRKEAFEACRYTIDELKHRVPIWKKEFYADGSSIWVRCQGCAKAEHLHA